MKFEYPLDVYLEESSEAASLKLIEHLENHENFKQLFDYWNSLDQYQLAKCKSDDLYQRIVTCLASYLQPGLTSEFNYR